MPKIPEPGRLAAHVLADAVSALDLGGRGGMNSKALALALSRLNEIEGAVVAKLDEETGEVVSVDMSNLLGGVLMSMHWLVTELAEARGVDQLDVIASLREALDE